MCRVLDYQSKGLGFKPPDDSVVDSAFHPSEFD